MAVGTLLSFTNIMNASPKEYMEPLAGVLFKRRPSLLDISLQLSKKLLDGVEIRGIRR